jgi:glycosyltransferase involved in cell wall biosynthesis
VVFSQQDKTKLSEFFTKSEIIVSPLATEDNGKESNNKREKYVYICRLHNEQKQIMRLINIFEKNEIELDVYGSGSQKNDVEEFCRTARYVNYKGFIKYNEVKNAFSKYKANVIYSDYEGMPYTILEAASVNTPTITSNSFDAASGMFLSGNLGVLACNECDFIKSLKNFDSSKTNPKKEYIEKYSMPAFEQRWLKIIQK